MAWIHSFFMSDLDNNGISGSILFLIRKQYDSGISTTYFFNIDIDSIFLTDCDNWHKLFVSNKMVFNNIMKKSFYVYYYC